MGTVRLPRILVLIISAISHSYDPRGRARAAAADRPRRRPVLRLFPPCALVSHAQGSSGVVDNMPFAWRGHTKSLATRARPSPDLAVWLE